ncbi:hypothetical protein ElyMa_007056900 [Elysia marginata]|uniref:Uncharacterized protein n=1 Tax=Elysia marginata TaxID=1093978 RepID=A0AAV4JV08_9GAST|nr:hypothetical protein ElyMa_007056900 [Elysia marginata]
MLQGSSTRGSFVDFNPRTRILAPSPIKKLFTQRTRTSQPRELARRTFALVIVHCPLPLQKWKQNGSWYQTKARLYNVPGQKTSYSCRRSEGAQSFFWLLLRIASDSETVIIRQD